MYNMQNNMQKNSAMFRFCIFCILQYAKCAEYVKEYATVCKTICKICQTICRKIVPCSDSAYFAYCNMNNMQNMSNNMLQYAKQYAKYGKEYAEK